MSLQFLHKLNGANNGHFKKFLGRFEEHPYPSISWYVSAGTDFRNSIFLNDSYMSKYMEGANNWKSPEVFLYTDYYEPFFDKLFPEHMTANFVKPKSSIEALLTKYADLGGWNLYEDKSTTVSVKQFEYLPTIDAAVKEQLVDFMHVGDGPKKVAYMLLEVCSRKFGRFDVHLIYANVTNEFMGDLLVKSSASVTHITRVRYGSGFGFAKASGTYLLNILHKLNTDYFICDPIFEPNNGDKTAGRIYPNLKSEAHKAKLLPIHVIPSESWSCHGDVTVYKVI